MNPIRSSRNRICDNTRADHANGRVAMRNTLIGLLSLAVVFGSQMAANAAVLADARADFTLAGSGSTTASFNSGSGVSDSAGSGYWNYYQASDTSLTHRTLLAVETVGNLGYTGYGSAGTASAILGVPAILTHSFVDQDISVGSDELVWHPASISGCDGQADHCSSQPYAAMRWTAGATEAGTITIAGAFAKHGTGVDGDTDFHVVVNGVEIYSGTTRSSAPTSYSVTTAIFGGQSVDFLLGPGASGAFYGDESVVSAQILNAVPEPTAGLLCISGAFSLLAYAWRKRYKRQSCVS